MVLLGKLQQKQTKRHIPPRPAIKTITGPRIFGMTWRVKWLAESQNLKCRKCIRTSQRKIAQVLYTGRYFLNWWKKIII